MDSVVIMDFLGQLDLLEKTVLLVLRVPWERWEPQDLWDLKELTGTMVLLEQQDLTEFKVSVVNKDSEVFLVLLDLPDLSPPPTTMIA